MRQDLKEKFTEQFLTQELQTKYIRQIALENNTNITTVYSYIKKFNLKILPKGEKKFNLKLKNQKFGRLLIQEYAGSDKFGKILVKCLCECGNTSILVYNSLVRNLTLSCGCFKKEVNRKEGYKEISASFLSKVKRDAIKRHIPFNLSTEDIWNVYINQNKKCKLSNVEIKFYPNYNQQKFQTASIDRIDSTKGYYKDNIQIVHKRINILKGNLDKEELKFWIKELYHNLNAENHNFNGQYKDIYHSYLNNKTN